MFDYGSVDWLAHRNFGDKRLLLVYFTMYLYRLRGLYWQAFSWEEQYAFTNIFLIVFSFFLTTPIVFILLETLNMFLQFFCDLFFISLHSPDNKNTRPYTYKDIGLMCAFVCFWLPTYIICGEFYREKIQIYCNRLHEKSIA